MPSADFWFNFVGDPWSSGLDSPISQATVSPSDQPASKKGLLQAATPSRGITTVSGANGIDKTQVEILNRGLCQLRDAVSIFDHNHAATDTFTNFWTLTGPGSLEFKTVTNEGIINCGGNSFVRFNIVGDYVQTSRGQLIVTGLFKTGRPLSTMRQLAAALVLGVLLPCGSEAHGLTKPLNPPVPKPIPIPSPKPFPRPRPRPMPLPNPYPCPRPLPVSTVQSGLTLGRTSPCSVVMEVSP